MTIEEAKSLMTPEKINKLKEVVAKEIDVDISKKINNDLIMTALCRAVVVDKIIDPDAIDERLYKLLNSDTNTVSDLKLSDILKSIHDVQKNMYCVITLQDTNMNIINEWKLYEDFTFNHIFEFILDHYKVTPHDIREKMSATLKPTIVNNIGQLISKYQQLTPEEKAKKRISITTINRIVSTVGGIMTVEFKKL
jgi:hypothetical protein